MICYVKWILQSSTISRPFSSWSTLKKHTFDKLMHFGAQYNGLEDVAYFEIILGALNEKM